MPEFEATDLVNLGKYNIYLKLMVDGVAERPFSAQTLYPAKPLEVSNREKIVKVSRERYSTPRAAVDEKIAKWTGTVESSWEPPKTAAPSSGGTVLYDARCAKCGKDTKVIFPPDGKRPIYCKSCLNKEKNKPRRPEGSGLRPQASEKPAPSSSVQLNPARFSSPPQDDLQNQAGGQSATRGPVVSLEQAISAGPTSFSPKKVIQSQEIKEKPKRKEVNLDELKKVLEESLKRNPPPQAGSNQP